MMGRARRFGLGLSLVGMSLLAPGWCPGQDARPPEPPLERVEPLLDSPRPVDDEFPVTPPSRLEGAPARGQVDALPPPADELPRDSREVTTPREEAAPSIIDDSEVSVAPPVLVGPSVVTITRPVWVAGHFEKQQDEWVKEEGFWTKPLLGAPRYIAPSWRRIPGRIEWVPGHWRQTRVAARPVMSTGTFLAPADSDVSVVEFDTMPQDDAPPPGLPPHPGAAYVPGRWKMGLLGRWKYTPGRWVD